ncbi:MAG: hypothetical protein EP330_02860 [Deltaproteobacteria bacterium]|nr:MAG: hypothetical protein EP330_02860 [Deltaproteobacteria bacterium]
MLLLLASFALASDLVIQATVPAEIHLDGQIVAELFTEGELRLPVAIGDHALRVFRNGDPQDMRISVKKGLDTTITVGRTGITTGEALEPLAPVDGVVSVEFRVDDVEGALLVLGDERHRIAPGTVFTTDVKAGSTPMSVRNTKGTVVWATGDLNLTSGPVVVQIRPGRMPEVPSLGGSFSPTLD